MVHFYNATVGDLVADKGCCAILFCVHFHRVTSGRPYCINSSILHGALCLFRNTLDLRPYSRGAQIGSACKDWSPAQVAVADCRQLQRTICSGRRKTIAVHDLHWQIVDHCSARLAVAHCSARLTWADCSPLQLTHLQWQAVDDCRGSFVPM